MPYLYKRVRTKHRDFVTRTKCVCYNFEHTKSEEVYGYAEQVKAKVREINVLHI